MAVNTFDRQYGSADAADATSLHALLFQVGQETYAVPSASVREIMRYRAYTPVPGAPPQLPGIVSQRGAILPVVDLRALLGLAEIELTRSARLVVAQHGEIDMCLLVEAVFDLDTLSIEVIDHPPTALEAGRARFLRGVVQHGDRPVALLDLEVVIASLREGASS